MSQVILREIETVRQELKIPTKVADEFIFTPTCAKFFFNKGELSKSEHRKMFTDGENDGGIDCVWLADDEPDGIPHIVLMQGKWIESVANKQDVVDALTKMHQTLHNFRNDNTALYNARLKKNLREALDGAPANASYQLVVFFGCAPDESRKSAIADAVGKVEELREYDISLIYADEIDAQINNVISPAPFVPRDVIKFSPMEGVIRYRKNGLLVNVRAMSLKRLFEKHKDHGLFEQNFRYFVRNKRIDDSIRSSLTEKRDLFWYLNNGIIIACRKFRELDDGETIELEEFSIINGCQTTTQIGTFSGDGQGTDFSIPCKIVSAPSSDEGDVFLARIAEASNSQKPISERDLKSNRPEQKQLQAQLREQSPPIFVEIKRGEVLRDPRAKAAEKWQRLSNDKLVQMIAAFFLQIPGTARSGKASLFSDSEVYTAVFKRNIDPSSLSALVQIDRAFQIYADSKAVEKMTIEEQDVVGNGRFVMLSALGLLLRYRDKKLDLTKMQDSEKWKKEVQKNALKKISVPDDMDALVETTSEVFTELTEAIASRFEMVKVTEKTVSNYFKKDDIYAADIALEIAKKILRKDSLWRRVEQNLKLIET